MRSKSAATQALEQTIEGGPGRKAAVDSVGDWYDPVEAIMALGRPSRHQNGFRW